MKSQFHLLALLCLALAIFATGCKKADDASPKSSRKSASSKSSRKSTLTVTLPGNVKLEMKQIKAGSFLMGSPESGEGRFPWETQHRVTLTRDYWLGTYEVTQAQWRAVMGNNPSHFQGDDLPVEQVSWEDAKAFCEKLNSDSSIKRPKGYRFDLPTEAQWEYACRGGRRGKGYRYSGGDSCSEVAWYVENSGKSRLREIDWQTATGEEIDEFFRKAEENECQPHPCGGKSPNELGLYDMSGNVWEWCRDWFEEGYADDPEFLRGQASGSSRVDRGGSWSIIARSCRSAFRSFSSPGFRFNFLGFRLALVPVQ